VPGGTAGWALSQPSKRKRPGTAETAPVCNFGWPAPPFAFAPPATDGRRDGLTDIRGERGRLVMVIEHRCPCVLAGI